MPLFTRLFQDTVTNFKPGVYVENVVCSLPHYEKESLVYFPKKYTFIMSEKAKCEIKDFIKEKTEILGVNRQDCQ